jgi:DNA-directed RNA polymerase specialized sigma24 family protein
MIPPRPIERDAATSAAPHLAGAEAGTMRRLCDRTVPDLYALALRIIGGAREAEEVVEQTLLEAWSARGAASAHLALLVRRCRSLALVRSGKRSIEGTRRAPASVEAGVLDDHARAAGVRAIGRLSDGDLRLAAMVCFEGYSVSEIAARTRASTPEVLAGLARILGAVEAEDGTPAVRAPRALGTADLERSCVLHAFDLLEGAERERFVRRLQAGDRELITRLGARERAATLLALTAPPATPGPALQTRLVRAAAGGIRA